MTYLKKHLDLGLAGIVIIAFLLVASQRLASVPVPDTDESYMLQASYEMLYRGHLGWPMLRLLGGNIDTNLHSFMPVHFLMQTGFLKVFGWGLLQGRIFNLIMSTLMLAMLYGIGRMLFGWRTGLTALLLVVCDITFLERSRYLRNDYGAAMFALLAFYLYETAEQRKTWRWYVACGLAAGASLMTHTTGLYMVLAIALLMLVRRGWRALAAPAFYQYVVGVFAVSAYEIVSCVFDFRNVLLQNRDDRAHFGLLQGMGWWRNIKREPKRYYDWYQGSGMPSEVPRTLLHLIQILAVVGVCYLVVRLFVPLRGGNAIAEPRVRVLMVTAVAVCFIAVVAGQKHIYYMAHLAPWFALCAAIFVGDLSNAIGRLRSADAETWKAPGFAYRAVLAVGVAAALGIGWLCIEQTRHYLHAVRSPDNPSFEEFKNALRSLVPEGECPVAVREPVLWLAFPEHDLCFANIQVRTRKAADIDGKEFVLIVAARDARYWVGEIARKNHHLLGSLTDTPYGSYEVYYTGTDARWLALEPREYKFFAGDQAKPDDGTAE